MRVLRSFQAFLLDGGAADLVQMTVQVKCANSAVASEAVQGVLRRGVVLRGHICCKRTVLVVCTEQYVLWCVVKAVWLFNPVLMEVVSCMRNHVFWPLFPC